MEESRFASIMAILIPQVITLIMGEYKISEAQATEFFYSSELYSVLEDEPTKLWHLSPHALFDLFQEEQHTGKITYPEEV